MPKATICLVALAAMILIPVIELIWVGWSRYKNEERLAEISSSIKSMAKGDCCEVENFLSMREEMRGFGNQLGTRDFTGVYILHNETKNQYYVGQSKNVLSRVACHFRGEGNGDVYHDYRSGDHFVIKTISLAKSGYENLNELERDTIRAYDAFENGYNRTRGNR